MMPWNRNNRPKPEPPVELLTPQALIGLLAALVLAVGPHARELPVLSLIHI